MSSSSSSEELTAYRPNLNIYNQNSTGRGKASDQRVEPFNPHAWIDAANILVNSDDPLRALELLKLLPAKQRDNPPEEIVTLEKRILSKLVTSNDCIYEPYEPPMESCTKDAAFHALRGRLVMEDVKLANKKGISPTIVEWGPGNYWLAISLLGQGLKFQYCPLYLDHFQFMKFCKTHVGVDDINEISKHPLFQFHQEPKIFVAQEILEHLWDPRELEVQFYKHAHSAQVVHLSTPMYNYFQDEDPTAWHNCKGLLHYRTYTPTEFQNFARQAFPHFFFQLFEDQPMSLRGVRHGYEKHWA